MTSHTESELRNQRNAWEQALAMVAALQRELTDFWQTLSAGDVVVTGCGSTYYLSLTAAAFLQQQTGRSARAAPASQLFLYPDVVYSPTAGTAGLIAISRSGETSETVRAVEEFRATGRGPVLAITCYPECTLAQRADLSLAIPAAQEESVVQTRSFAAMLLAAMAATALWSDNTAARAAMSQLPERQETLLHAAQQQWRALAEAEDWDACYFLGSGPRYGLACEASLKMTEMALTHSHAYHFHEFRHGPKSMISSRTVVIGLLSSDHSVAESAVLEEMRSLDGRVIAIGDRGDTGNADDLIFASGLAEPWHMPLCLPPLQWFACTRALTRSLNPDEPRHLQSVVHLDFG